jgi:flagellar basal body P-ring protein FlgI
MNHGLRASMLLVLALAAGCNGLSIRSQSPEDESTTEADKRTLVGDCATAFGMYSVKIESVGLVTNLPGTGSDPPPSSERARVMSEMKTLGVENPNQLLASPNTDLVLIRGYLRPGIQEGDRFDVEVRVPTRSENKGLRGGWLMSSRLTELAVAGGSLRQGEVAGTAEGPILVDPSANNDAGRIMLSRGRVLNGGVSKITRPLGLVIKPHYRTVHVSSQIGAAVNRRFHTYKQGVKAGCANPKTDQFIDLTLHPRYKDNVERFVRVVRSLPLKESSDEQLARLALLERNLLDPITSASAALKLEAVGKPAIPVLKKGLESPNVEVRFYAAEALAYLDERAAAAPLGEIARDQPAFRAFAMAALGAMDDFEACETLRNLLSSPSAETRYGAFRALWAMNEHDPYIIDQKITDEFHYHVLDVTGPPMIHFTRNNRPEFVVFGRDQRFTHPLSLEAGPRILLNSTDPDHITVSRFEVGRPDQKRVVSMQVDEVIRAISDLGGTYPDVVQALQQAKATKALPSRLEMEAVPKAGRIYQRESTDDVPGDTIDVEAPTPDLFPEGDARADAGLAGSDEDADSNGDDNENEADDPQKQGPWQRFWSKMTPGN